MTPSSGIPPLQLVEVPFAHVGLNWQKYVGVDQPYIRPAEVDHLIGNPAKAHAKLGWRPTVDFKGLVTMMVDSDLKRLKSGQLIAERDRPRELGHPL